MPSKTATICTHPFEWFEIHPDGQVFLCCPAWLKHSIGNLLNESVSQIWNGAGAQMLRKAILNGSFHQCSRKRCPRLPTATAPVMRLDEVRDPEVAKAIRQKDVRLAYGPKKLNLCFDRSCNLACPTCRNDFERARGEEKDRVSRMVRSIVEEAGRSAQTLILSGLGDPFGSPSLCRMLQDFRPENWPKLQEVQLHSNGQLWDEALWKTMEGIHPFVKRAEISVDAATAETYAVNRRGGNFARLLGNLAFVSTLPIEVKISMVVQKNNYRQMPTFVELARRRGFSVYFSQLVNWGTFAGEEFRKRAVHRPDHPKHSDFIRILKEVAAMEGVDVGNLRPLLAEYPPPCGRTDEPSAIDRCRCSGFAAPQPSGDAQTEKEEEEG